MKRKALLTIIPALMLLSSCAGAAPKAAEKLFLEDNLAHEEIFEQSKTASIRKLAPIDTSAPAIAIQKANESAGFISIRFVAAVKITGELTDATAVWTRTMYQSDGHVKEGKERAQKPSTKAYTSINDGGSELTIAAFNSSVGAGADYTHFVVYTMRNIPISGVNDASDYYLNAYLTLNDGGSTTSKVLATRVDQSTQLSFNVSDRSYFAVKKTASGFVSVNVSATETGGNHAIFDNIQINSGEGFVIVNNWVNDSDATDDFFEIHGYDKINGEKYTFEKDGDSQFAKASSAAKYYLFLSSNLETNNKIYISESVSKTLTLKPNSNWQSDGARFALYVSDVNGRKTNGWFNLTGSGSSYSISLTNIQDDAILIFCRDTYKITGWDNSGECE